MTSYGLISHRPKEDLILDSIAKVYVSGKIVQYLTCEQIDGLRFLYKNHKNKKSCILNDEYGSGKCFQTVAFLSTISKRSQTKNVLIICQNKNKLLHWCYHCSILLDNVETIVADDNPSDIDVVNNKSTRIVLATVEYALKIMPKLQKLNFNYLIVNDEELKIPLDALKKLKSIKVDSKIVICSADLIVNLSYFYEILKFINQCTPLVAGSTNRMLKLHEFKEKFGNLDNKCVSKRNMFFKRSNLLNSCQDFYLRRICDQTRKDKYLLLAKKEFENHFERWKLSRYETVSFELDDSCFGDSIEIPSSTEANNDIFPGKNSTTANQDLQFTLESKKWDEIEAEMPPLIYDFSDSDVDDTEATNIVNEPSGKVSPKQLTQVVSTKKDLNLVENKSNDRRQSLRSTTNSTNLKGIRKIRSSRNESVEVIKKSESNHRNITKKFFVEIKNNEKKRNESKGKLQLEAIAGPSKTIKAKLLNEGSANVFKCIKNRARRISNTSDVQVLSQKQSPPIFISSSSELSQRNEANIETNFNTELRSFSPDLFGSSNDIANQHETDSDHSPITAGQTKMRVQNTCENFDIFSQDSLHATKEFPTEILSPIIEDVDSDKSNINVFEITKNNVFHNVLRVHDDDTISPIANDALATRSPNITSFTGLRIILPRLNMNSIMELANNTNKNIPQSNHEQTAGGSKIIDLTDERESSSSDIQIVNESEKTPERKRLLTPSTRSCIRPHIGANISPESSSKPRNGSHSRSEWLSKRNANDVHVTPRSRRRLDKWYLRPQNINYASKDKTSKSRNIFREAKSKYVLGSHWKANAMRNVESPNIFSSDED